METEPINEKQLVIDNNETSLTEIQTELDAKPEVDPDSSMMIYNTEISSKLIPIDT